MQEEYITSLHEFDVLKQTNVSSNRALVLIFSAPWCQLCTPMKEFVESQRHDTPLDRCIANTPDSEDLVEAFEVTKLPAVFVYSGGNLVGSTTGLDTETLKKLLTIATWNVKGLDAVEF
jgi:thioredoxin-related protein